jgi:transcriptional regulator with XRE-family HTH domain
MFNKTNFKIILEKALGNRTKMQYSDESGVNRTYISKYLNEKLDNPPNPDIIKKLAEVAQNNVTYEDLMIAAGYLAEDTKTEFKPVLTAKDEKDIAKELDSLMTKLKNEESGPLYYNGNEVEEEDAELFKGLLEVALKKIKIKNKETYTPKKYRK